MAAALTYFDLYADAFRRGVMTEGQLVSAVRLGRITLPQAFEIRDTAGKCGALWTPPVTSPAPTPAPEAPPTPAATTPGPAATSASPDTEATTSGPETSSQGGSG